jgi:mRNA interferase RelE/StbE
MAFRLQIKKSAEKNLDKLPEDYRLRVLLTLRDIQINPYSGKALSGDRKGQYSARVWPYRIIYTIKKQELIIVVIEVDHRGHIRNY